MRDPCERRFYTYVSMYMYWRSVCGAVTIRSTMMSHDVTLTGNAFSIEEKSVHASPGAILHWFAVALRKASTRCSGAKKRGYDRFHLVAVSLFAAEPASMISYYWHIL